MKPLICFSIGRYIISLLDPSHMFDWCWGRHGYDHYWYEYYFGWFIQVDKMSDFILSLEKEEENKERKQLNE